MSEILIGLFITLIVLVAAGFVHIKKQIIDIKQMNHEKDKNPDTHQEISQQI